MYQIGPLEEIDWPVTIRKPCSGGKIAESKVMIRYPLMEKPEFDAVMEKTVFEVVGEVVKGWGPADFGDAQGAPLPFSAETLDRLRKRGYVLAALFDGFVSAQRGALEKNG